MDFLAATDVLTKQLRLADLAAEAGVSADLMRKARMDQKNPGSRRPPKNWKEACARLARRRASELEALADKL